MSAVLEMNQKTFRFMGYVRPHLLPWFPSFIPSVMFTLFSAFLMYTNILYVYANLDNMNKATGAVYVMTAMAVSMGSHIHVSCKKSSVERLYDDLAQLVNERIRKNFVNDYTKAEERSAYYTKWAVIGYICIFLSALFSFAFLFAAFNIYVGNLDTSTWFSPYKVVMPFDETTIKGFFVSLIFQCCGGYTFMLVMMSIILFYMGLYIYSMAFIKDFQSVFEKIDLSVHSRETVRRHLIDVIQFHEMFLRINRQAVDILSGPIFFLLIFNIAFIATSLYQIEVGIMTLDPELSTSLMGTTIMFTLTFFMNLLGSNVTATLAEVGAIAYDAQWHRYPIEMQKFIGPIVQNSQQTINFHGYNVVLCNLDVFMRLIKSAFSYYIMVRKVSQI